MRDKNLHTGHRERLRNRFLSTGILGFSEHELLELMLFYAIPRSDTNELAHMLINRFGSLSGILKADISDLSEVKGLGSSAASFIKLIDRVTDTVGIETIDTFSTDPLEELRSDLIRRCAAASEDLFSLYYINCRYYLCNTCSYQVRAFLSGEITPRRIIEDAITIDAPNVIIGICHQNQLPIPCSTDYDLIKALSGILSNISVIIDDAVIAGSNKCFSLRSDGAFSF